jgi:hypothetical protein
MAKKAAAPLIVIEWSPSQVSWVDGAQRLVTVSSLAEASSMVQARDVVIAISRRCAFIRAARVPNAGRADVHRILQVQIGQMFPIPANELAFDFHLTQDVNLEGRLAVIAAMRAADLVSLHSQARDAGFRVTRIVPAAFGSAILAQSLHCDSAAIVHRTAEGLSIDLVAGGELRYSRVAALPENALGIEAEVSRTFAAAVLSCSPTIAAGGLILPDADISTDRWSVEMLADAHLDINIETEQRIAARERGHELQRVRLSVILLGMALILFTYQFLRYSDSQALANQGESKWNKQISSLRKLRDVELALQTTESKLQVTLNRAFHPGQSVSDVMTVVSNSAPPGIWLTGLSLERGKALTLRGTATKGSAVTDFQTALVNSSGDDEPRFRDVKLLFANNAEIEKSPVVQFSISGFPVGNLPLADPTATKGAAKQ